MRAPPGQALRCERGQATVELALVLPVVALAAVLVLQVGLVSRDRVVTVHAARAAARAVSVRPDVGAAQAELDAIDDGRFTASVGGDLRPGGLATVTVTTRLTTVPLLGRLLPGVELSERLVVRVEG